ncbi:MAG: response regulator, partial [Bdellovibrionota bacterium]
EALSDSELLKNQRILVIDDSRDNQVLIQRMLERRGAHVDFASDGRSGVELAQHERFDLILMDLQMPEIDGFEATRRLRAAGSKVPIVALTAHVIEEVRGECTLAGCDGFLAKPIQAVELLKTVRALATHH